MPRKIYTLRKGINLIRKRTTNNGCIGCYLMKFNDEKYRIGGCGNHVGTDKKLPTCIADPPATDFIYIRIK